MPRLFNCVVTEVLNQYESFDPSRPDCGIGERTESGRRMRCRPWRRSFLYALFFSLLLFLLFFVLWAALKDRDAVPRVKRSAELPLRFGYDGSFKILQVADMHYANGLVTRCRDVLPSESARCSDVNTTLFLKRMIDAEKPDLIVFTGDSIFGASAADAAESLFKVFRPAMDSRTPWAAILGNHDQESTMSRLELMLFISLMDYSISQVNPSGFVVDGYGNYDIRVHGAWGSEVANTSVLNLYFLDSGDRAIDGGVKTYGWIKDSQLTWLHTISEELQGRYPSPALSFFHIPIPQVRELWFKGFVGQFQEAVGCSSVNSGVLQSLTSMGDVKAVFIGHDHLNDFCGKLNGIWFCYGGGFGYHGYGRTGWPRRARVISAQLGKGKETWAGVETIRTWKRLDDEKLTKIDEQVLWSNDCLENL
ncbi:putative inactive purple acid phosphatase 28 isoform X2 [Canna indica]|uniref:Inactive purple acid phosphatase 28 isoform X2 n=1 Tax=Canna indica TaxID=4628 RepID=A0AAQ3QGG6_9LILI|nr:putative inactive purple acid phosphatase 28 isoform X2 [Canna indica]